jgi:hypothetical protein
VTGRGTRPPLGWSQLSVGGRSSGPDRAARTQDDAEVEERDRGFRAGPTGPRCGAVRHGPRAGEIPGGGAARSRSGAETGRPAGRPEKARLSSRNESCKESVQRARNTLGGAGLLTGLKSKGAEGRESSKMAAGTMHRSWVVTPMQGLYRRFTPAAGFDGQGLGPLACSRQTVTFRACKTCAVTRTVTSRDRSVIRACQCLHPSPQPPGARAPSVRDEWR